MLAGRYRHLALVAIGRPLDGKNQLTGIYTQGAALLVQGKSANLALGHSSPTFPGENSSIKTERKIAPIPAFAKLHSLRTRVTSPAGLTGLWVTAVFKTRYPCILCGICASYVLCYPLFVQARNRHWRRLGELRSPLLAIPQLSFTNCAVHLSQTFHAPWITVCQMTYRTFRRPPEI